MHMKGRDIDEIPRVSRYALTVDNNIQSAVEYIADLGELMYMRRIIVAVHLVIELQQLRLTEILILNEHGISSEISLFVCNYTLSDRHCQEICGKIISGGARGKF